MNDLYHNAIKYAKFSRANSIETFGIVCKRDKPCIASLNKNGIGHPFVLLKANWAFFDIYFRLCDKESDFIRSIKCYISRVWFKNLCHLFLPSD